MDNYKIIRNESFVKNLKTKTKQKNILQRIHYISLLNITEGMRHVYNSDECKRLNNQLTDYIIILQNLDKPINKFESLILYKEYIYPSGYHLERKSEYMTNSKIQIKTFIGIIIDLSVWYLFLKNTLYFFILFTLIFYVLGKKEINKAKKKGVFLTKVTDKISTLCLKIRSSSNRFKFFFNRH